MADSLWPDPAAILTSAPSAPASSSGLWPNPETVLNSSKTSSSGSGLWPDPMTAIGKPAPQASPGVTKFGVDVSSHPFNPLNQNNQSVQTQTPIKAPSTGSQFLPALGDTIGNAFITAGKNQQGLSDFAKPTPPPQTFAFPVGPSQADIATANQKADALKASSTWLDTNKPGNTATKQQVDAYNAKVTEHNQNLKDYQAFSSTLNKHQDVLNNLVTPKPYVNPLGAFQPDTRLTTFKGATGQDLSNDYVYQKLTGAPTTKAQEFINAFETSTIAGKILNMSNPDRANIQASGAEGFAQAHPALATVAKGLGMLTDTVMLSTIGAGFNLSQNTVEAAGGLANLFPTTTRIAGMAVQNASIFGIQAFLNEGLSQAQQGEFKPGQLASATAGGLAFGAATGGAGGLSSLVGQVSAAGAGVAGLTALEKYVQNGKLTSQDLVDITVNASVAMIFQAAAGYGTPEEYNTQDMQKLAFDKEINDIQSRSDASYSEAKQMAGTLRVLSYSRVTGQEITPELMNQAITGMINIEAKPISEMNVILQEIPESFRTLPPQQQADIIEAVSEKVQAGEPTEQAIKESVADLPGAGTPNARPFINENTLAQSKKQAIPPFGNEQHPETAQQAPFAHADNIQTPAEQTPFAPMSTNNLLTIKPEPADFEKAIAARQQAGFETPEVNISGFKGTGVKPSIGKTSLKTLVQNLPEFKANPVMNVIKTDNGIRLQWKGSNASFEINPDALKLETSRLQPGQQIQIDLSALKGVGAPQQMRVYNPNGTVLAAEIIPGLSKTIQEDVIPKAKGLVSNVKEALSEVAHAVNPTGSAPASALTIIMTAKGQFEKAVFRTEQTQKAVSKGWDKVPEQERLQFMNNVEQGKPVGKKNQALADMYRVRLNNLYHAISKFKDVKFLENFFPHFWQKPGAVEKNFIPAIAGRKPLEGAKSFLHHRIFATIQEGMKAGWKPVTTNPEEMMQIYEMAARKFLMAQQIKAGLKKIGMFTYLEKSKRTPEGYSEINDNIAKVYFPPTEYEINDNYKVKLYPEAGRYVAPTDVARLINNHLSTDWISKTQIGRGLMKAKNGLNILQLGFSAFHVTMETLISVVNGFDVAISKTVRGDLGGALFAAAKAPFNVITYWRDGQRFFNNDPELIAIENDLFNGGATLKKNQYFKNTTLENFMKNVREGTYPAAILRATPATLEGSMRLIFSQVPKVKIGAFRELFAEELLRKADDIASGKITRAEIARSVWNNIENRFGQLNYDNLFWNRTFKAINMLLWRAVGWNLGTIRELGGGSTQDLMKFFNDAVHGRKPDFTPKMRFVLALLALVAGLSSIYEYLHTGHGPRQIVDYIAPENGATDENGDPVRINWPVYTKDILSFSNSPLQTVANKMSPELTMTIELMQNRDYYGNYIWNPNDNLPIKLQQQLKFVAGESKPFSISNQQSLSKEQATGEQKFEGYMGLQKAPSYLIETPQTKAIFGALPAAGPKTPEQQQLSQLKNQYRKQIQQGNVPSFEELKNAGIVTSASGYRMFIKAAALTPVQRSYKTLPKSVKATIPK